jgi:hypothetical protein
LAFDEFGKRASLVVDKVGKRIVRSVKVNHVTGRQLAPPPGFQLPVDPDFPRLDQ